MSSIADLCQGLVETEKSIIYPLVDRLIQLILTLPVSTITTEQILYLVILILTPLINNPNSAPVYSVNCFFVLNNSKRENLCLTASFPN